MIRTMRRFDLLQAAHLERELFGPSAWSVGTLARELDGPDRFYVVWDGPVPARFPGNAFPPSGSGGGVSIGGDGSFGREEPGKSLSSADGFCANGVIPSSGVANARVRGYAGIWTGGPVAEVLTIGVAASAQGHGVGRRLLDALVDHAHGEGCRAVELQVRVDNFTAQGLYRAAGFTVRSTIPHYYQPEDVDAFVMRLDFPQGRRSGESERRKA